MKDSFFKYSGLFPPSAGFNLYESSTVANIDISHIFAFSSCSLSLRLVTLPEWREASHENKDYKYNSSE